MLDLFAIAEANATAIEQRFQAVVAEMPPEQAALVREFASWVEAKALISINVRLYVVEDILNGKSHQNTYEFAEERARQSGRATEDILRERLQPFYERRVAFDRAFRGGQKFRYGAMHAGGAGLTDYGPYCVVLTRTFQESLAEIAYLRGGSLEICVGADATFDQEAVRCCAAPHTHRHLMAAIERASEIPALEKREWYKLVASQTRYFEVIFIGEVSLNAVECVCVLKAENDRMWELAFASFGRKLDDGERALAHDYVVVGRAASEGRLRLEVVACP